jgi:hypothetical protein
VCRFESVPVGELREISGRRGAGEAAGELVRVGRPPPVPALPAAEEQHQPFDVPHRKRRTHAVERVSERMRDSTFPEERRQLVDRRSQRLEVAVILLRDSPREDMKRHAVLGEPGRDLLRDEGARSAGKAQGALDRVVVGDGHEGHAPPSARPIDMLDGRVRLAQARPPEREVAGLRRVPGMDVEVAAHSHASASSTRSA